MLYRNSGMPLVQAMLACFMIDLQAQVKQTFFFTGCKAAPNMLYANPIGFNAKGAGSNLIHPTQLHTMSISSLRGMWFAAMHHLHLALRTAGSWSRITSQILFHLEFDWAAWPAICLFLSPRSETRTASCSVTQQILDLRIILEQKGEGGEGGVKMV